MKSIIKSVTIRYNVVTVVTKSDVVRHYTFKSNELSRQYYNDITSWHYVVSSCHDKETWWCTSQCNLSTKQLIYFYKLNTRPFG